MPSITRVLIAALPVILLLLLAAANTALLPWPSAAQVLPPADAVVERHEAAPPPVRATPPAPAADPALAVPAEAGPPAADGGGDDNGRDPRALVWDTDLPPLPVEGLGADGLSGAFAGAHRGALLVIGGSHYPNAPPWEGGAKSYHRRGWFLFPDLQGNFDWRPLPEPPLPQPLAHGTSISTPWGVVVAGGNNQFECSNMARLLTWDGNDERLIVRELPPLPHGLTRAAGAMVDTTIYLLGGEREAPAGKPTRDFLALDLGAWVADPASAEWQQLPRWQGPPRSLATAGVTSDGERECLFLIGGRGLDEDGRTVALADGYKFDPSGQTWTRIADVAPNGEPGRGLMAAAAAPGDEFELLVFGGDDNLMADVYHLLSQRVITSEDDAEAWRGLNRAILENHPGYPREVLRYNARDDAWDVAGHFPTAAPLASPVIDFAAGLVIPGGEISPGRRTDTVHRVTWDGRVVIRRALPAEQPAAPEAEPVVEEEPDQPPPLAPRRPEDDPSMIPDEPVDDEPPAPAPEPSPGDAPAPAPSPQPAPPSPQPAPEPQPTPQPEPEPQPQPAPQPAPQPEPADEPPSRRPPPLPAPDQPAPLF